MKLLSLKNADPYLIEFINNIVYKGLAPNFKVLGSSFTEYDLNDQINNLIIRDFYTANASWAIVNNLWIKDLSNYIKLKNKNAKVIELYAGKGLIAKHLKKNGINIKAYDDFSWNPEHKTFTKVIEKDAISVIKDLKYNTIDFVLMSWIPFGDESCIEVVKIIKENQPKCKIIYIGEGYSGCNACNEFFEMVDLEYSLELNVNFENFYGIHDAIYIEK